MKHPTNRLLDLCRIGMYSENTIANDAASEIGSYIVFASLFDYDTTLPEELENRVTLLMDVESNPDSYPKDIIKEVEATEVETDDDGPLLA